MVAFHKLSRLHFKGVEIESSLFSLNCRSQLAANVFRRREALRSIIEQSLPNAASQLSPAHSSRLPPSLMFQRTASLTSPLLRPGPFGGERGCLSCSIPRYQGGISSWGLAPVPPGTPCGPGRLGEGVDAHWYLEPSLFFQF